jgi:hypothetical protein
MMDGRYKFTSPGITGKVIYILLRFSNIATWCYDINQKIENITCGSVMFTDVVHYLKIC